MKILASLIMLLVASNAYALSNYYVAVKHIEHLNDNPKIVRVAVKEVDIPPVYNATQLNEYCQFEWGNEGAL